MNQPLRVVIVGGGISGLSAAWYLQQQAHNRDIDIQYTVLEQAARWGGKVHTETVDLPDYGQFVVEAGPDSFITQKPWAYQLAQQLGLEAQFLGTNDEKRHVYVLKNGQPVILPDGVLLIVPTKFMPFALSPLISPLGKLRMGLDLLIPARQDDEDETLADFIRRRLGNEALEMIAEPLMSGIYNAEAEKQSLMATFPRFRAIEQKYGSLIRGMLAARQQRELAKVQPPTDARPRSVFLSLQAGTRALIEALVQHLTGDLRLNSSVQRLEHNAKDYRLHLDDGETLEADAVILTVPAYGVAQLVRPFAADTADQLDAIRYVSTGTLSLAYRETDIRKPLNGFGVVVPVREGRPINALTLSSIKFDHRAPDGTVLLRVFFGGSRSPQSMELDDAELLQVVQNEVRDILGIEAQPLFHRIYRWHRANPQYDVGHLERVAAIEASLPPGLWLTGSAYRGVGLPDCIHQSEQTVSRLLSSIPAHELVETE